MAEASSKAHATIDSFYDQISENEIDVLIETALSEPVANDQVIMASNLSYLKSLNECILIKIVSYIDEPINFSISCKYFWNIISAMASYRIFAKCLQIIPDRSCLLAVEGSSHRVPAVIRAFGNGEIRVESELMARNLELALYSPAFRAAFDENVWAGLRGTEQFKKMTDTILMESQDDSFIARFTMPSPEIEAHRRTLLCVLASLPLSNPQLIERFFYFYPISLLNSRTETVFQKWVNSISERIALISNLTSEILGMFSFDLRLLGNLVKIYLQNGQHDKISSLLFSIKIPHELKDVGLYYVGGCISIQTFFHISRQFLNVFDAKMEEILTILIKKVPSSLVPRFFSSFLDDLGEKSEVGSFCFRKLTVYEIFHLAVLKMNWSELDKFQNFDFSYEKEDSDFLSFLIERNENFAFELLNRNPRLIRHKAFLTNSKYQSFHFGNFILLRNARIELKRTISCLEITRAYIKFIREFQVKLFNLLLKDSGERISKYFTTNLKDYERKRYKEHPSFTIAISVIDVSFESIYYENYYSSQNDPESVLKSILLSLSINVNNLEEYFEIAHELPTFCKCLYGKYENTEEEVLYVPEAALTQSHQELSLLSKSFALNLVIHDGSAINYRLVLNWFENFGLELAHQIIPIKELKCLIKGAAFNTFHKLDDKKQRFHLDNEFVRNETFSMTFRFSTIIIVSQCRANFALVIKKMKSIFGHNDIETDHSVMNFVTESCSFYNQNLNFFSNFKYIATNSRSERFLLEFIRRFIHIKGLINDPIDQIVEQFFNFINFDPFEENLLKDHLIYFVILASFKLI